MLISLCFVIVCFWLWLHGAFPPKDPPNQQTAIEERGFESKSYIIITTTRFHKTKILSKTRKEQTNVVDYLIIVVLGNVLR